jgi:hypothetical protein
MNELILFASNRRLTLIAAAGDRAQTRFREFFVLNIRNSHARRAYARAAVEFFDCLLGRYL